MSIALMYFLHGSTVSRVSAEQILTKTDVDALMNLVRSFSHKWNGIGLGLGYTPSELNLIKRNSLQATSSLEELLSQWVQWPTVNHPTKPTLRVFCETLRSSFAEPSREDPDRDEMFYP